MKVKELVQEVDRLFPNQFTAGDKLRWLERFHDRVWREIVELREDAPERGQFHLEMVLPVPDGHADAYKLYLEAQIHYHNAEAERYNDAVDACNAAFAALRNWYNATHMPRQRASHLHLI